MTATTPITIKATKHPLRWSLTRTGAADNWLILNPGKQIIVLVGEHQTLKTETVLTP